MGRHVMRSLQNPKIRKRSNVTAIPVALFLLSACSSNVEFEAELDRGWAYLEDLISRYTSSKKASEPIAIGTPPSAASRAPEQPQHSASKENNSGPSLASPDKRQTVDPSASQARNEAAAPKNRDESFPSSKESIPLSAGRAPVAVTAHLSSPLVPKAPFSNEENRLDGERIPDVLSGVRVEKFDRARHQSFVYAIHEKNSFSLSSIFGKRVSDFLVDDTSPSPLGKYARKSSGEPDIRDFALNFFRQPLVGYVGDHRFEFGPVSIGTKGDALDHAILKIELRGINQTQKLHFSINGRSWSHSIADSYIYRWLAEENRFKVHGIEIVAKNFSNEDLRLNDQTLLMSRVYFKIDDHFFVHDTKATLLSQYVPKLERF